MSVGIGNLVGYCIRFEDITSACTKLKYMTDGMLLREALLDPLLIKYSVVVLDEAHERTVQTDVLFGIVKEAQMKRMKKMNHPLKIVVMSATMDADHFSNYFNNAPVLYLEGRQYPVQIMHSKETQEDYTFSVMVTVFQIHKENPLPGDILVFLTGQDEIDNVTKTMQELAATLGNDVPKIVFSKLYASLPATKQLHAFQPTNPNVRRVTVATNVAETSITLKGVKYVVDSGYVKARTYIPNIGLDILKVQKISKAQAWQRAGRAGRECSGTCYRMYTEAEFRDFHENTIPEIQRCSLASIILQLLVMGIENVRTFDFIDKPSPDTIANAIDELYLLGAVNRIEDKIKLTSLGKQMSAFPVDPHLAKIILASKDLGCSEEIVSVIALISGENLTYTPASKKSEALAARRKFMSEDGDLMMMLKIFQEYKRVAASKSGNALFIWCREHFLNIHSLKMAEEARKQLMDICSNCGIPNQSCSSEFTVIKRCLVQGLFMNTAELQLSQEYVTVAKRQAVSIHPSSCLFKQKPNYILFTELFQTKKTYMKNLCVVESAWLQETNEAYFKNRLRHMYSTKSK